MSSRSGRRIERSCAACHRRKVRCDKKFPCSQCIRSSFECSYPPAGPVAKRARKTTINDVASRISQMERTIESFRAQQSTSPQPSGSTSSITASNTPTTSTAVPSSVGARDEFMSQAIPERTYREGLLLNKGRVSHYVNEVLLSRVIEQVCQPA